MISNLGFANFGKMNRIKMPTLRIGKLGLMFQPKKLARY